MDGVVASLHREAGDEEIASPLDALERIIARGLLETFLHLMDHHNVNVRSQHAGTRTRPIHIDYSGLLRAWLAGRSVASIADEFLGAVPDRTFRSEQLSDVIATTCEHFMPWALGVVARWLKELRAADFEEDAMPFCPELPMCMGTGSGQ